MNMSVALQLGRVSNLPTVWSNVLVGTVLAGGEPWTMVTVVVMIAVSLLYVGGMYLNDAFDHEIDARERPNRPIPAGLVAANTVFAAGFGMLLAGIAVIAAAAALALPGATLRPVLASVALAAAIVFYDWNHKGNALSPLFMGLCRVLAYVTAGYVAVGVARSGALGRRPCRALLISSALPTSPSRSRSTSSVVSGHWPFWRLRSLMAWPVCSVRRRPWRACCW